jgi:hypothetical protein
MNQNATAAFLGVGILVASIPRASDAQAQQQATQAPSQAQSLNISEMPITKYIYGLADAAYGPGKYEAAAGVRVIDRIDSEGRDGFQALAVEISCCAVERDCQRSQRSRYPTSPVIARIK